jgi:small subunit ribosomal protein S20
MWPSGTDNSGTDHSTHSIPREQGFTAMANIKSQKKRNITNEKRHERNKAVKAEVKTRTKRAEATIGTDENADAVKAAVKRIDSAASKGMIHKNTAARKKSRLMKKVNAAG